MINPAQKALEKSYQILRPFSDKYKGDFKRFLFSLNLLSSKSDIKNKRILDIGSGIGIMAVALRDLGAEVMGIDKFIFLDEPENLYTISDFEKLQHVWEENNLKIIKSDIAEGKFLFASDYFDIVICDATIEHLNDSPQNLFKEVCRILKNGGLFLVTTPNYANLLRRIRFLLGRSPNWDIRDFFESGKNFRGHRREFTISELVKMLEWSSLAVIEKTVKNIFFKPRKFFIPRKMAAQVCRFLSYPFPAMREIIYVLAKKK